MDDWNLFGACSLLFGAQYSQQNILKLDYAHLSTDYKSPIIKVFDKKKITDLIMHSQQCYYFYTNLQSGFHKIYMFRKRIFHGHGYAFWLHFC